MTENVTHLLILIIGILSGLALPWLRSMWEENQ